MGIRVGGASGTSGGSQASIKDEGSVVVATPTSINFTGAGVTASDGGSGVATVTIPGGASTASALAFTPTGTIAATDVQAAVAEAASEAAQKSANLSDLTSASTARTNLGLGSVALLNAVAVYTWTATKVAAYTASSGQAVPLDPTQRIATDGVRTSGSATLTSASAAFTSLDVGRPITGTGIAGGTTIAAVGSSTSITLSANATSSGSGTTITIGGPFTLTLPATATDATVRVRNVSGTNNATIAPPSGSFIDGSSLGITLPPGDSVDISAISSTDWYRV